MRKLYLLILVGSLLVWGCRKGEEAPPSAPQNLRGEAVNDGQDLKLTWDAPDEGTPSSYEVICDNSTIASNLPNTTTTYTINGSQYVCKKVQVVAVKGSDRSPAELDLSLTPTSQITIYDANSYSSCPPKSWGKLTTKPNVSLVDICQSDVTGGANTAYFVYKASKILDCSETSVSGSCNVNIGFGSAYSGNLAPSTGYLTQLQPVQGQKYYIYTTDGYYGIISINSVGSDNVALSISLQNKVPGLRWVKQP
jgi:hypothetical protein